MAELMKSFRHAMRAVGFAGCMLFSASTAAQALPDPTRPPDALNPAQAGGAPAATAGPVLQSVLIAHGRKAAIISGKEVPLNGKFGNARVISITETEVVLREGRKVRKLKLFPAIEMQKAAPRRAQENE